MKAGDLGKAFLWAAGGLAATAALTFSLFEPMKHIMFEYMSLGEGCNHSGCMGLYVVPFGAAYALSAIIVSTAGLLVNIIKQDNLKKIPFIGAAIAPGIVAIVELAKALTHKPDAITNIIT